MNKTKRKYKKQCKCKIITFYKKDAELLAFANSINFQKFVKDCLKCEVAIKKQEEDGDFAISLNREDYDE